MARKALLFVVALLLVAAGWELYKAVGPATGGKVFGWNILPRTSDAAMPHVWDMGSRLFDDESRTSDRPIWRVVLSGAWYSFRLALTGFVIGTIVGVALATVMARFQIVRRGLLPYLVISQTVPMIALAPLVVSWGGRLHLGSWEWPRWLSVAVLGAFLAFFPVAVGTLRGLESATATSLELMRSFAASGSQTMRKLRFPAAVPFMVPALRLAATAAVIGVVVAEISTGLRGGVGRLVIEYARQASGDPAKVYTAVFGAAVLGLAMAGLVAVFDGLIMRNRPRLDGPETT
ncbi:MAG: ABC transporter permease subunit [Actinomycetota bacterium]|nr:ABC transporter permease subunit [Acidimicrobiia bacterium]MDQ3470099.1 ABC transporter permease subunit [Actinomycetota bacterium]